MLRRATSGLVLSHPGCRSAPFARGLASSKAASGRMNNASSRSSGRGRRRQRWHRFLTIGRHPGLSPCSNVRAGEQRRPWWLRPAAALQRSLRPGVATRVPVPGSFGASVQPCTRSEDGCGWWVWLRPHPPPAGLEKGPPLRGQPRRGRGDGHQRVCSGFASIAEVGAQCPVSEDWARSWPYSLGGHLAERLRPIGETAPWLVRQRAGGSALSGALRRKKVLLVQKVALAVHAVDRSNGRGASVVGCRCKAGLPRRNQEHQRLVGRTPLRKRTPERRTMRGSKRVKRREPRHPPRVRFSSGVRESRRSPGADL
jgi:hypothetical protein